MTKIIIFLYFCNTEIERFNVTIVCFNHVLIGLVKLKQKALKVECSVAIGQTSQTHGARERNYGIGIRYGDTACYNYATLSYTLLSGRCRPMMPSREIFYVKYMVLYTKE